MSTPSRSGPGLGPRATPCRSTQRAFVARGEAAIRRWKLSGDGQTAEEVMADLQQRLDEAKAGLLHVPGVTHSRVKAT